MHFILSNVYPIISRLTIDNLTLKYKRFSNSFRLGNINNITKILKGTI